MEVTGKFIRLKPEWTSVASLIQENVQREHFTHRACKFKVAEAKKYARYHGRGTEGESQLN